MPFLILIASAVGGAIWWWIRNNPRDAIHVAKDAATTIRNAPRRLAFRRQTNAHPVEGIDDPRIAIATIARAFVEAGGLLSREQQLKLHTMYRTTLLCAKEEADELEVLSQWLIGQCNGPGQAVSRLARRLYKIDGDNSWEQVQGILADLVADELTQSQIDAIDDVRLALRK